MHKYMILVEVSSTAPLYGADGIKTSSKVRVLGVTKASNSSKACSKVSKKLGISYDKLKALLYTVNDDGKWMCDKYALHEQVLFDDRFAEMSTCLKI